MGQRRKKLLRRTEPGVAVGSQEDEQRRGSPVKSGQGDSQATLTARTHGTPRDPRLAEGSQGSDSILTLPLVRLALALARRGFTASAIHSASATSRSVSVKLLQFTQAAQFRPPECHVTSTPPLGQGRRQQEPVRAATWDKLVRNYLCPKGSAHSCSGPAPAQPSPRLQPRPVNRKLKLRGWPQDVLRAPLWLHSGQKDVRHEP